MEICIFEVKLTEKFVSFFPHNHQENVHLIHTLVLDFFLQMFCANFHICIKWSGLSVLVLVYFFHFQSLSIVILMGPGMSSCYSLVSFNAKKNIILFFLFCGKKKQHLKYSPLITSLPNLFLVLWI